ncbi:MAG: outer membrane beta-barrel protein [Bacteroidia bacterium]|nr:outer membrane beta-barrel protein [Bacteroidia bacterium]
MGGGGMGQGRQGSGNNQDFAKLMKDIKGRVYGKILDARTKKPIEYASVMVLWHNKDSILGGVLTKENGDFNIEGLPAMGGFRIKVVPLGYKTYINKFFIQAPKKLEVDLGNIMIEPDEKMLAEVEVKAEKSTVQLAVDRKIYNVEKDLSVRGGTALDALKNVPTISVDADGNATLRERNAMIYVDGRPTTLNISQIPADQIDRIEVISNPGAKFEAAASGGIINIVLKKNKKPGYNGMLMGNIGTQDRYGLTANLNIREHPWAFTTFFSSNITNYNRTFGFTKRTDFNVPVAGDELSFIQTNNNYGKSHFHVGRFQVDYNINIRNTIGASFNIVKGKMGGTDVQLFENKSKNNNIDNYGRRTNKQWNDFENLTYQLTWKKTFPREGKEISADLNFNQGKGNTGFEFLTQTWAGYNGNTVYLAPMTTTNNGGSKNNMWTFQLDFTDPYSDGKKLEAGVRLFYKQSTFLNNVFNKDLIQNVFVKDTFQSNNYLIDDMVNAAYITHTGKLPWNIGYNAGLRFEQTYYAGTLLDKNRKFEYNYPFAPGTFMYAWFPSFYLTKKFGSKHELQFNISRKIDRPNFFQSMPFIFFSDNRNYRIGNAELRPEFNNIAEINYNFLFEKGNFLSSFYTRYNQYPITNYQYPSATNPSIMVSTFVNGKDQWRYGFENTLKWNITEKWNAMLNVDVFYILLNSGLQYNMPEQVFTGWSYRAKLNTQYTLPWGIQTQLNAFYDAPKRIINGWTRQNYSADLSFSKTYKIQWTFNLTISDIFNTRQFGNFIETPDFVQEVSRRRETRFIRFSITYLFGKFDTSIFKRFQRGNRGGQQQGGMQMGEGDFQ